MLRDPAQEFIQAAIFGKAPSPEPATPAPTRLCALSPCAPWRRILQEQMLNAPGIFASVIRELLLIEDFPFSEESEGESSGEEGDMVGSRF